MVYTLDHCLFTFERPCDQFNNCSFFDTGDCRFGYKEVFDLFHRRFAFQNNTCMSNCLYQLFNARVFLGAFHKDIALNILRNHYSCHDNIRHVILDCLADIICNRPLVLGCCFNYVVMVAKL